jgi:aspartyl protease family protein
MSTTLRNVLVLIVFGLLLTKGLSGLTTFTQGAKDESIQRVVQEQPAAAVQDDDYGGDQEMVLYAGPNGHFMVEAWVDGTEIEFLVDTGATMVVLSADDASRLGMRRNSLDFTAAFETANGIARAAPVTLRELRIGSLELDDVNAAVMEAPIAVSLLGRAGGLRGRRRPHDPALVAASSGTLSIGHQGWPTGVPAPGACIRPAHTHMLGLSSHKHGRAVALAKGHEASSRPFGINPPPARPQRVEPGQQEPPGDPDQLAPAAHQGQREAEGRLPGQRLDHDQETRLAGAQ